MTATAALPRISFSGIGDEAAPALDDQLTAIAALCWDAVELRTIDGVPIADLPAHTFDRLAERTTASGITVTCLASGIGGWSRPVTGDPGRDTAELAVLARRCQALNTRFIRVMSYPGAGLDESDWARRAIGRLRDLAGRAEQAGVVLLHENCVGWAARDADRTLRLLDGVASPAFRLLFDTGNGVAHGYDAYPLLERLVEHVAHVHVKDARPGAVAPVYTLPGAGTARVGDCLRLLLGGGYTGALSIEPHLAFRPHESTATGGDPAGFIAAGRALERLVADEVLPGLPGWRPVTGGLVRG